jgi:hypothetical protein
MLCRNDNDKAAEHDPAHLCSCETPAPNSLALPVRMRALASPDYLARRGEPRTPADLHRHACINWRFPGSGSIYRWQFEKRGKNSRWVWQAR